MNREYFYNIDPQGRLFHEDSELTDPDFLDFFFARLQSNDTTLHPEYAYVSRCGRELNFVSCPGCPVIFRSLVQREDAVYLLYAGRSLLAFEPEALRFNEEGQLFYPLRSGVPGRLGRHALLELSHSIEGIDNGYRLRWNGRNLPILPLSTGTP